MVFSVNSPTGLQPQMQYVTTNNAMMNRRQAGLSLGSMPLSNINHNKHLAGGHRPILVTHSHPMQMTHLTHGVSQQVPLINSPSSGNILHVSYSFLFHCQKKSF